MTETVLLLPAFMGGLLLGGFFYGGLWWTVRHGLTSPRPALWFCASYLLRTSMAMAGLYFIAGGRWQNLLVCLSGCIMARFLVMRRSKRAEPTNYLTSKTDHAP